MERRAQEVERRAQSEAKRFSKLFVARFPEWESCQTFFNPTNERGIALFIEIPSENPAVATPLRIHVKNGEVLVDWDRYDEEFLRVFNTRFLKNAIKEIDDLVSEKRKIVIYYSEGISFVTGFYPSESKIDWHDQTSSTLDRAVVRSWRGTYDAELTRPGS